MTNLEYKQSIDILNKWSIAYYTHDQPLATDEEYDRLYHKVKLYEKEHPEHKLVISPTNRVGDITNSGFTKNKHIYRLWSMEDIFTLDELNTWVSRDSKTNLEFYIEPKFDGLSLNLLYDNGDLLKATTRGNGIEGEDVLKNALTIKSIPHTIPYKQKIEIRGEVVMPKDEFALVNSQLAHEGKRLLANPRNAAAGSLRQLDHNVTKSRNLSFYPWGVGYSTLPYTKHHELMSFIYSLGFLRFYFAYLTNDISKIEDIYHSLIKERDISNLEMDGMVIRLNDITLEKVYGYTNKFPKYMVAYKFPPREHSTIVKNVIWQVGRTGVLTPVAVFDPVDIGGAMVNKATLHNYEEIQRLNLAVGDTVSVIRSGDVIPKILSVLRTGENRYPVNEPKTCPICTQPIVQEGVNLKCSNLSCKSRIINNIIHYCSRQCMDIDGVSGSTIEELYNLGIVSSILDLYTLKYDTLIVLDGYQDKKVTKILSSIEKSKTVSLSRLIYSLGIELVGEVAASKIANTYPDNWRNLTVNDLVKIEGIGNNLAVNYTMYMYRNKLFLDGLLNHLNVNTNIQKVNNNIKLTNKTFVITGTLSKPRVEIAKCISDHGGVISSNVSSKTDYLVCGENAGSKLEKAKILGIQILTETDLTNLLNT